jgi:hypothetical protein
MRPGSKAPALSNLGTGLGIDGSFHTSDIIIAQKGSPEFISLMQQYFIFMTECSVA